MEESILSKGLYYQGNLQIQWYPKLPTVFLIELEQKKLRICRETQKALNNQRNLEKEKNEAGGIGSLTSDYTTKLQSPKQYGTDPKTEIQINGKGQKTQK